MAQRIEQLDSLRGLAALTVVFSHAIVATLDKPVYGEGWWSYVYWSPLHCFFAGHQSVAFFFVLSGFVLALPFYRRPVAYAPWIAKRICRICIPYYAATVLAIVLIIVCRPQSTASLTAWFNDKFEGPITLSVLVQHFLLIGSFRNSQLNPVVWSLVVEMRLSLLFPLLIVLVTRLRWPTAIVAAYALAFTGAIVNFVTNHTLHWQNDYHLTLIYIPQFVVGCLLASHQRELVTIYHSLRRSTKIALIVAAMFLYSYPFWFFPQTGLFHLPYVDDQFTTLGVIIFIVSALSSTRVSSTLLSRPLVALGKASYSLYLVHAICLLAAMHLWFGIMPIWGILTIAGASCACLTTLFYFFVEIPSIKLGQQLSTRLLARQTAVEDQATAV